MDTMIIDKKDAKVNELIMIVLFLKLRSNFCFEIFFASRGTIICRTVLATAWAPEYQLETNAKNPPN